MAKGKTSTAANLKADLVVIGGGGAGMAAAITAKEKGVKNIILLEKRKVPGGNSAYMEGIFAAESPAQQRMGIEALCDDIFKQAMDTTEWRVNPRMLRAFINESGNTIRWLEGMGLIFDRVRPLYPHQHPLVWHSSGHRLGGPLVKTLAKRCETLGIKVLCQTAGKKILTDSKGKLTEVLAEGKDGEFTISTNTIIISSGGYGGNKKMLAKYYPFYSDTLVHRGLLMDGDGIQMAMDIGCETDFGHGVLILIGPYCPWSWRLTMIARRPETIWVNKNGERFADECAVARVFPQSGNAMDRQPGKVSYTLFDSKVKQLIAGGEMSFLDDIMSSVSHEVTTEKWLEKMDELFKEQIPHDRAKIANSWDEIAKWIGAKPEALKATIKEFNSYCDHGYDADFIKNRQFLFPLTTPPYYAIKCVRGFDNTVGGIKINHHMEAINQKDTPVPGLYAAGVDAGGYEADTYNCRMSGTSIGFAVTSGRIAGQNAAQYVKGK